jgi:hypothetical protein
MQNDVGIAAATYDIPTLEDVEKSMQVPRASGIQEPQPGKEVMCFGTGIYQAVQPAIYDTHMVLACQMAADYGSNLWMLPTNPRLTFPLSCLFPLASAFKTEELVGRKFDWLIWVDDDVAVPRGLARELRKAADPEKRPFVAAVGYDRHPPFRPAVWEWAKSGDTQIFQQWEEQKPGGVHQVACTGLCAAIFHRSLFDKVPEPWFVLVPPKARSGSLQSRMNPDSWWCSQLDKAGIPIYVSCDLEILHMGQTLPIGPQSAKTFRQIFKRPT